MSAVIHGADFTIELLLETPTPYVDAVTSGLIGYWRLGDPSGTAAAAVVGSAATYTGSPTLGVPGLLTGDPDTAVRLSGVPTSQYITLPASAGVSGAHSAFFWFERLGPSNGSGAQDYHALLTRLSRYDNHPRLLLNSAGTAAIWQGYDAGDVQRTSASLPVANPNGRHMYGWVYDGSACQAYLDGVAWGAPTACVGLMSTTAGSGPAFGTHIPAPGTYQANGIVDELRVYNRAVTPAEVAELYRIGIEGPGGWTDLTCQTTSAEWQWGAPEALGPLTECEGGTLRVSMIDPDRDFDPDNPDSPLLGVLKVGSPMRVMVDGTPAWTGALQTWAWDRASMIADLNALDPIGMLSVRALPEGQTLAPVAATTTSQVKFMLDLVEWPASRRYFPEGDVGVERGNHYVEGPAIDGLQRIRFAELGRLYPMRDGRIGWHTRMGPAPPAPSAIICGGGASGVALTDMWKVFGLGRLRNRVVINGGYGDYGPSLPPDEYRTITTSSAFLSLLVPNEEPFPYDAWANTILDALNPPPVLTMLGTILPEGPEVTQVVCAEFGARWTVLTLSGDKVVQLIGERVSVDPDMLEVTAVTEDVTPAIPVKYALMGAGSGYLTSSNTISYANARAGSAVVATIPGGVGPTLRIGQTLVAGPLWELLEGFMWFDTSSIPAGATILRASFAAMILPRNLGAPPAGTIRNIVLEVRSGYAWRPTLAAADWRPGAGIAAAQPLRAQWNTADGYNFQDFEDAGSGLAGAIVKGGETQLLVVSDRTVSGTAPTDTTTFEDWSLQWPRLRVTYTVP